jgi:hypothetical protein
MEVKFVNEIREMIWVLGVIVQGRRSGIEREMAECHNVTASSVERWLMPLWDGRANVVVARIPRGKARRRATCFAQLTDDVSAVPAWLARVRQVCVQEHQVSHHADGSTGPLGR